MRLAGLSALLALALVAAGVGSGASGARTTGCPATLANQLESTGSATQLVTVVTRSRSATHGSLRLWRKSGDCWLAVAGPWWSWVGGRGVSARKREDDRTTPAGMFGFGRTMYGVAPNPGLHYPYRRVVCGDWWVEDPASPAYNRFRHVRCGSTPPFRTTSEDLSRSPTAYRHFAVIAYNSNPVVSGRGSGIFLHATTGGPTLGCVSLALPQIVRTLRWLSPAHSPAIVIGTAAQIRAF